MSGTAGHFLRERFRTFGATDALIWRDHAVSYAWLDAAVEACASQLDREGIVPGSVVGLHADFSPNAAAFLIALIERACVVVPLTTSVLKQGQDFVSIARCAFVIKMDDADAATCLRRTDADESHPHYDELRARRHPGLVLFSSGSTGKSKAAVHDFARILEKFETRRPALRTISFLLYDHIGGVNTLFHVLSNGGCLVTVPDRSADTVLAVIEKHRVEVLPTSPTFINLVLMSEAYKGRDLSSLKIATYGTEPMHESTLRRFHSALPHVKLQQTYGLSELGILRAKSKSSTSLWMKVGGEGFETRIEGNILHIRARSAMLGYLNAPSPFTEDGWFVTGDLVETDGEYLRILGRQSEMINVGGEKVTPAEVESVIQEVPGICEATVYGEKNLITGMIVCARVRVGDSDGRESAEIERAVRKYCRERLAPYKIPVRVFVDAAAQHSDRFKRMRSRTPD